MDAKCDASSLAKPFPDSAVSSYEQSFGHSSISSELSSQRRDALGYSSMLIYIRAFHKLEPFKLRCGCIVSAAGALIGFEVIATKNRGSLNNLRVLCNKKHNLRLVDIESPRVSDTVRAYLSDILKDRSITALGFGTIFAGDRAVAGNDVGLEGTMAISSVISCSNSVTTLGLGIFTYASI